MRDEEDGDDAEDDFGVDLRLYYPFAVNGRCRCFGTRGSSSNATLDGARRGLAEDDEAFEEDFETCVDAIGLRRAKRWV